MLVVKYSCHVCGLANVEVEVPYRDQAADIVPWFDGVILALGRDHFARNPSCVPERLHNIELPVPAGAGWLGGPVLQ